MRHTFDTIETYVISLDTPSGRTRLDRMRRHLKDIGSPHLRMIVQPGVYGKELNQIQIQAMTTKVCGAICTPSAIGCAASHAAVWRRVIESGRPYAVVLEDDTVLVPDIQDHLHRLVRIMPRDTDIVLLGCYLCGSSPTPVPAHRQSVVKSYQFSGTHAYLVTRRGAQRLLEHAYPVAFHIDMVIGHLSRQGRVNLYRLTHDVASQTSGEDTSENVAPAPPGFPGVGYTALKNVRDAKGQSFFFLGAMPAIRVGSVQNHTIITCLDSLVILLGMTGWVSFPMFGVLVLLDTAATVLITPRDDTPYSVSIPHAMSKAVALFSVGWVCRWLVIRLLRNASSS